MERDERHTGVIRELKEARRQANNADELGHVNKLQAFCEICFSPQQTQYLYHHLSFRL